MSPTTRCWGHLSQVDTRHPKDTRLALAHRLRNGERPEEFPSRERPCGSRGRCVPCSWDVPCVTARETGSRIKLVCLDQDYRFGHPGTDSIGEPRLRCNVFALLSRSILLSSPVRLQIGSGQGVPATPAATLPTPLRPCLSATPRSGCPALAALPSGHRQRPDPAQHVTEQPPVQMSLGQQQPVVAGMFDQTAAGLH